MIKALVYHQRADNGEVNSHSLPDALVDVIEVYRLSTSEQEKDQTSHTGTTLKYCGKPEQNAEKHISEDKLAVIASLSIREKTKFRDTPQLRLCLSTV
jgi:hypothetical protein